VAKMEVESLMEIGFSEREAKVYLAMLDLGEVTVGPIASKTGIQHAKIYPTLEKLIKRGLATYITKSKTKYFRAEEPKRIISILKEKERKFREIIPLMEKRKKEASDLQHAKIYEGFKAIKAMYEDILEDLTKDSFYYVFPFKQEYVDTPLAQRFLRKIHLQLSEFEVDDRMITHSSIRKEFRKNYSNIKGVKFRFTDMEIPLGLIIMDNKVINVIWGERPTAVEIQSRQIAEQYKKFFLDMWKQAKK
jgi:HTH-type transcriptional regulator, sugar sensing transcriptional regulator